jgi:hypothetical protein
VRQSCVRFKATAGGRVSKTTGWRCAWEEDSHATLQRSRVPYCTVVPLEGFPQSAYPARLSLESTRSNLGRDDGDNPLGRKHSRFCIQRILFALGPDDVKRKDYSQETLT